MTQKERNVLITWAKGLSNTELEAEYYNAVYDSLGSQTEAMYELGYDMKDIKEQEELEEYKCCKADLLEKECCERGIKLWEEQNERFN